MTFARAPVCALALALCVLAPSVLAAQTVDDGIMMPKGSLFTGNLYSHDSWNEYWEGALKRDNGNIGTLTTRTNSWFANYGMTYRLNIIGSIPYVWTRASQGVLHGMRGLQDLTIAAKFSLLEPHPTPIGSLRIIAVGAAAVPLTDYTPDFQPLSIGSGSQRASGRLTVNLQTTPWYVNGSTAYSWRRDVTLDRPYYYTKGELFFTDRVDMPNVFDYVLSAGYLKRGLMATVSFSQQRTLGGGDIRRQDMPFVSNRMNFSKIGGMVMYPIPKLRDLNVHFAYAYTIDGRNVGQATTVTTGLLYAFHLFGETRP